ncbi:hypothetical protein [Undibacterium curvum]|uniref:Uncharacterized protein n=1 Tax=Undibacterium curvum TaxID=2762294 RepID=A0ABR7A5A3_9BURK|nr:hypothetical protein [Undibacterium curvum]MBC3932004.1 hypothetical protein [Undibacterium curvum]
MAKRTWTYAEITYEAEARINYLMEMAAKQRNTQDPQYIAIIEGLAFGAYCLWNDITQGKQAPGDAERLKAMTEVHRG